MNPIDEKGQYFIKDTYHFREMLSGVAMQHGFKMGSLDIIGMFPNIPVKKALEIVRVELENDETLSGRTKWKWIIL